MEDLCFTGEPESRDSGPSSFAVDHLHQDHQTFRERSISVSTELPQHSLWGSSRPKETWPWPLADSFMISVRKGHGPRRTKLALGSLTRVRATCIFNELPEARPSNADRNTAVTQSHRYRHQKSNESNRPRHGLMHILPRVIHPRTPDRTRPSLHSL